MPKNPFKIGDVVVYRPSSIGHAKSVTTDLRQLRPGERYKVVGIEKDDYLVLEGFESSPTGGLYWTEFERVR